VVAEEAQRMSHDHDLVALATTFLVLSLFAVGGALSALPEMHRVAVEAQHWMTNSEFADMVAIAQLSPGPNVLVVTLIGYHVAGALGALVATFSMVGPSATLAFIVSRTIDRSRDAQWPRLLQDALVPVSIGLMAASATILGLSPGQSWLAVVLMIVSAALSFASRVNPMLLMLAGALLGFAGLI
jgi:chromate transporter